MSVRASVKGIVCPKIKCLSLFTHPHDVPNPYDLISTVKHEWRYFAECPSSSFPYNESGYVAPKKDKKYHEITIKIVYMTLLICCIPSLLKPHIIASHLKD